MDFSTLKRSSSLTSITKAIEDANSKKFATDEREWQPTVDKAGNGFAVIRFLPAPPIDGEEGLPWVRLFTHGFKGPGGQWLIENCPTTLTEKCPVCDHNSALWNSGEKSNKDLASAQKRKLVYITNIMVITDAEHPENEGKIKIFKFGKKIFDKLTLLMNPTMPDEAPINPFDMWTGANFKLKVGKVAGYRNYDDSKFASQSALLDGNDKLLEDVWQKEYSLKEFIDPKKFKAFEEIEKRLLLVLGSGSKKSSRAEDTTPPVEKAKSTPAETKSAAPKEKAPENPPVNLDDDADLDSAFFQELADE